jgi:hypothetical protein
MHLTRNKINIILLILIGILGLFVSAYLSDFPTKKDLTAPGFIEASKETPIPTPTPAVFQYDDTTNLGKEIQMVNPTVENNDFSELQDLLPKL